MKSTPALVLATVLISSISVSAQTTAQPLRAPDGSTHTTIPSVGVQPYKGMPFSGTATTVWTRPMEGGGTITTYAKKKVFRDSEGRVYGERHRFAGADIDPETTLIEFRITDPVTQTLTICEVANHHCIATSHRPQLSEAIRGAFR
jgi:hypothetical protein